MKCSRRSREELEQGLDYSHIGIGLLDYSTKEIVIQAEAGRRKGALGRRLGLDGNVVGRVARTGQMAVVSYDAEHSTGEPVLEGSVSAIALPIVYADQLHGVLYVETDKTSDFSQEEVLFLGTLADLISGALHNAMTFQKAQEQAITDGLTGLKTHRFFMEALSAEWKRSTRAGRSFSVVLMDLDRFKFVNDFYGHLDGDLVLQRVAHILEHELPALGRGGALWRRRVRHPDAGNRRRRKATSSPRNCARGFAPIRCCARKTSPPVSASPRFR